MLSDRATALIQAIPRKLGRGCAMTLFRDVFDIFLLNKTVTFVGGPAGSDTTNLFTAGHANLLSGVPLSMDGLTQAIVKLGSQPGFNDPSNTQLGLTPKFLLHNLSQFPTVAQLVGNPDQPFTADRNINVMTRFGIQPILVNYWPVTNTDWYLAASPQDVPLLEVDFLPGLSQPEVLVSDQPNIEGSAFWNADKIAFKCKFTYSVAILDYRGFVGSR